MKSKYQSLQNDLIVQTLIRKPFLKVGVTVSGMVMIRFRVIVWVRIRVWAGLGLGLGLESGFGPVFYVI